jgi:glycosyltransferase involved in cell wall biosynthesis
VNTDTSGAAAVVAVLIPCLNEESTVAEVVGGFRAALPSAEIYVFDNNSTDRTAINARAAGARVAQEPRRGKGHVIQSMLRTVDADIYLLVDGDCTYPADAAATLVEPILQGRADMVIGSRLHPSAVSEFDTLNRWGNQFFVVLARFWFGIRLNDVLSGYRAFTRDIASSVKITSGGFQVETELTIQAVRRGFRVIEVPVDQRPRPPGSRSKLRPFRDGFAILGLMWALYRQGRDD